MKPKTVEKIILAEVTALRDEQKNPYGAKYWQKLPQKQAVKKYIKYVMGY